MRTNKDAMKESTLSVVEWVDDICVIGVRIK